MPYLQFVCCFYLIFRSGIEIALQVQKLNKKGVKNDTSNMDTKTGQLF